MTCADPVVSAERDELAKIDIDSESVLQRDRGARENIRVTLRFYHDL